MTTSSSSTIAQTNCSRCWSHLLKNWSIGALQRIQRATVSFEGKNGAWRARPLDTSQDVFEAPAEVKPGLTPSLETTVPDSARYTTHVPVYDLSVAAGGWGPEGVPTAIGWIEARGQKLTEGMFAAQVSGRSMEPKIHDGEWCLFKPCSAGSRQNRLLLVQVKTHIDPEDGGRYTIKRYHSTKKSSDDEGWQHQTIELQPLNQDYPTIQLAPEDADELRIIGELVNTIREEPDV